MLQGLHHESPYTQLKQAFFQAYSVFRRKQIDKLLYHTSLGDRCPTELLAHMRELVGTHDSPELSEKLFLNRLPRDVRRLVVASHTQRLDKLVERAENVSAEDSSIADGRDYSIQNQSSLSDVTLLKRADALTESFHQLAQTREAFSPNVRHAPQHRKIRISTTHQALRLACYP